MGLSNNIHLYSDVAAVLKTALDAGGGTYRLDTPGAATRWMMRANKYRLLLQKQEAARAGVRGYQPPTPFDRMRLRRVANEVEINFNPQPTGTLSLPDGRVIKPAAVDESTPAPAPAAPFTPKVTPGLLEELAATLAAEEGDDEN